MFNYLYLFILYIYSKIYECCSTHGITHPFCAWWLWAKSSHLTRIVQLDWSHDVKITSRIMLLYMLFIYLSIFNMRVYNIYICVCVFIYILVYFLQIDAYVHSPCFSFRLFYSTGSILIVQRISIFWFLCKQILPMVKQVWAASSWLRHWPKLGTSKFRDVWWFCFWKLCSVLLVFTWQFAKRNPLGPLAHWEFD